MVESLISLATLIVFDLIIFSVVCLVFVCTRKRRNSDYEDPPEEFKAPPKPIYDETDVGCMEACRRARNVTDDEILEKANAETVLYLKLEKMLGIMLLIFAVLGCGVLCPIYWFGSDDADTILLKLTIANLGSDDMELSFVPVVLLVVFSAIGYYLIFGYMKEVRRFSSRLTRQRQVSVLEIYGFTASSSPANLEADIKKALVDRFGDDVQEVYVNPDYCAAYKHFKLREKYQDKLDHFKALNEDKGKQHKVTLHKNCCRKRDAVEFYEEKVQEETDMFTQEKATAANTSTSFGFVFCKSEKAMYDVMQQLAGAEFSFGKLKSVRIASDTEDIQWGNINSNRRSSAIKGCCYTFFLFLFVFFLCTPTTFISFVTTLLSSTPAAPLAEFIGNFLPTILLIVYMSVIIPILIWFLVGIERHHTMAAAIGSALDKFLLFFSFNLFIFPAILTPVLNAVIFEGVGNLVDDIVTQVNQMGIFFIYYDTNMALITNSLALLAIGRLISIYMKKKNAASLKDKALIFILNLFDAAKFYAVNLTVLIITLGYAVIVPLISFFGAMFFLIRYQFDRYNFVTIFHISFESNGLLPLKAAKFCLYSLFLFQLITSLMIMSIGHMAFLVIGIMLGLTSLVILILFLAYSTKLVNTEVQDAPSEEAANAVELKQKYTHPIEGEATKDWDANKSG